MSTNQNDVINGTISSDTIDGGNGSDLIDGGAGDDTLYGGNGKDILMDGAGDDYVSGGNGDDIIIHNMSDNIGYQDVFDGNNGVDTLVLQLTANQLANLQAAIDAFNASNHSQWFDFSAYNGGLLNLQVINIEKIEVQIVPNTAPVVDDGESETLEDTPITISGGDVVAQANDPDGDTVTVVGVTNVVGGAVSVATNGDINVTPIQNSTNDVTFDILLSDGTVVSSGTWTNSVISVNDAPAGADKVIAMNEDGSYAFAAADFGFTDPNDLPANTLQAVKITTLPAAGELLLNGVAVAAGDFINAADIANLTFNPAADANGNGYASFTFQVQDNGGTANGGVNLDQSANTITFNVAAVNDAPIANDDVGVLAGTNENVPFTFAIADLLANDSDIDNAHGNLVLASLVQPAHGDLVDNGDGTYTYTPDANYSGADSFKYTISDGDLESNEAEVTFNVADVFNPAVISIHPVSPASVTEGDSGLLHKIFATITVDPGDVDPQDIDFEVLFSGSAGKALNPDDLITADGAIDYTNISINQDVNNPNIYTVEGDIIGDTVVESTETIIMTLGLSVGTTNAMIDSLYSNTTYSILASDSVPVSGGGGGVGDDGGVSTGGGDIGGGTGAGAGGGVGGGDLTPTP